MSEANDFEIGPVPGSAAEYFDGIDELIVAHPSRVAQADQIAAAEPRLKRQKIALHASVPTDRVYIVNVAQLNKEFAESLERMDYGLGFPELPWRYG